MGIHIDDSFGLTSSGTLFRVGMMGWSCGDLGLGVYDVLLWIGGWLLLTGVEWWFSPIL